MIVEDMETILFLAFRRYSGADHLGKTVDIDCRDTEASFDVGTHLVGPWFRAETAALELELLYIHPFGLRYLRDVERVGGSAGEDGGAEILHEHDLALCISSGNGRMVAPTRSAP